MNARIADNVTLCSSIWKKGTGLMFRFPKGNFAYIFSFKKRQKLAITMWFVFYSIDIIFLDETNTIVEVVTLKPFSHYQSSAFAQTFIELPKGTLVKYEIVVGQTISWTKDFVDLH